MGPFGLGFPLAQASGGSADIIDKVARTPQSVIVIAVVILTVLRVGLYYWTKGVPAHIRQARPTFKAGTFFNEALDAIIYAGIFVFLIIRPYFVQAFKIPSGSMVSTLLVHDYIVANKLIYRYTDPKEGDIVVFKPPIDATRPDERDPDGQVNVDFIKRCIGVPGDVVQVKNNVLYRNGKPVDEPYKHFTVETDREAETFREMTPEEVEADAKVDFKLVFYKGQYWPVNIENGLANADSFRVAPRYGATDGLADDLLNSPPVAVPKGYYLMIGDNRNNSYDGRAWGLVPREDIVGRAEWIWLPISRFGPIHSGPSK